MKNKQEIGDSSSYNQQAQTINNYNLLENNISEIGKVTSKLFDSMKSNYNIIDAQRIKNFLIQ